jgi:hypothetical protein
MNCQDAQSSLSLYLYGELDFAHEEELETHLAECAACQLSLAREKQWHTLTNSQIQEPPLDLLAACRQQLRPALARETAAPQPIARKPWRWSFPFEISFNRWSAQLSAASLLLFIGFTAARWLDRGITTPQSPNPATALIRDIQTDNAGLVRIVVSQESQVTGHLTDPNVHTLLLSGTRQADPSVRFYSLQLLLNQDATTPATTQRAADVRQVLFDSVRNDPNPAVRLTAMDGLRRFSTDPAALDTLKFVLQHDDNPGVRYQAIDILVPPHRNIAITPAMTQTVQDVMRSGPEDEYVRARCSQILQEAKLPLVY